jgi:hypothetical protein
MVGVGKLEQLSGVTTEGNRDTLDGRIVHISRRLVAHISGRHRGQWHNRVGSEVADNRVRVKSRLVVGRMSSRPWGEAVDSRKPLEEAYRTRPAPGRDSSAGADRIPGKVLPAPLRARERRLPLLCLFPRSQKRLRRVLPRPSPAS